MTEHSIIKEERCGMQIGYSGGLVCSMNVKGSQQDIQNAVNSVYIDLDKSTGKTVILYLESVDGDSIQVNIAAVGFIVLKKTEIVANRILTPKPIN